MVLVRLIHWILRVWEYRVGAQRITKRRVQRVTQFLADEIKVDRFCQRASGTGREMVHRHPLHA